MCAQKRQDLLFLSCSQRSADKKIRMDVREDKNGD